MRFDFPLRRLLPLIALLLLLLIGALIFAEWSSPLPQSATAEFVGRAACIDCHREQHRSFVGSHHDLAMDVATEETVLASFDGNQLEHFGVTSTMFRRGDRFMVNTEGPDGEMRDYEVSMVFGYEPLQQYMVELKPPGDGDGLGQYQVLRLSWDTSKGEWFYLQPPDVDERILPGDPLHWTGITQRWNSNCATCHSTNLQKNFDAETGRYSTTFTDIDVSCEACHGPGSLHVAIANRRRFLWDRNHGTGLARLQTTSNLPQVESCAPCHSRRSEIGSGFCAGDSFHDHYANSLISDGLYHADGQIRDEVYVYGSFVQSRMFHQGIRCTDCHDPHSARVKFDDNRLCTSCHQHPAGKYDTPAHHHHQPGSTGSLCVECHMPATTYMAVDSRRDHSLRVPRPDLSVQYSTPNACTACHLKPENLPDDARGGLGQYLDWIIADEAGELVVGQELRRVDRLMASSFEEWYGTKVDLDPERGQQIDSHYYGELAIGRHSVTHAVDRLRELAVDRSAPAIFRASAIESLSGNLDSQSIDTAMAALEDSDPTVVATAIGLLNRAISAAIEQSQYLSESTARSQIHPWVGVIGKQLDHRSRLVRIEAARTLAFLSPDIRGRSLEPRGRKLLAGAIEELRQSLRINNDLASSHAALGSLYEVEGNSDRAAAAYRRAISVEPDFVGPRGNLATMLDQEAQLLRERIQSGGTDQTESIRGNIDELTQQANRLRQEENGLLAREVARSENQPNADRLFYRFGLSNYLIGELDLAEECLLKAHRLQPDEPDYLLALATFYDAAGHPEAAITYANRLIESDVKHPGYQRLRQSILFKIR